MAKLSRFLRKANVMRNITKDFDKDLGDISLMTETAVKERTPVVTGRLKSSITARKLGFLNYEVSTGVIYAAAVEFGAGFAPRAMFRKGANYIDKKGTSLLRRSKRQF